MPFFNPTQDWHGSFAGGIAVLPVVSVGNVPQLAVDIIISTLPDLKRVGFLNSSDLVPFVGGQERGEGGIVTALEVYAQEDSDVFWIQQRSPVLKSKREHHMRQLVAWLIESQFSKLLLLAALDGSARTEELGPNSHKHHHLPLPSVVSIPFPALSDCLPAYSSSSTSIPTISSQPLKESAVAGAQAAQLILPPLPGSGILSPLLLHIPSTLPVGVVLSFVIEGDNREDAKEVASVVDRVLDLGQARDGAGGWREPESWDALVREGERSDWA